VRRRAIIVPARNTRSDAAQGWARSRGARRLALALLSPWVLLLGAAGCLGDGGAVSVRWRIAERATGRLLDPRDVGDGSGRCCQRAPDSTACADEGWRITRVRVVLADPSSAVEIADAPTGLDASCTARELTTPFIVPEGLFAITLRAFDPAAPELIEAESPSPELRVVRKAEIVNLDVVALSVGAR
jgi:hypothetical protein